MQPLQYENSCWSDRSAAIVEREQMDLTQKTNEEFVKHGMGFRQEWLTVLMSNKACHPGGHYRDFYLGTQTLSQVTSFHFKIGWL